MRPPSDLCDDEVGRLLRQQRLALAFATLGLHTNEVAPLLDEVAQVAADGTGGALSAVLEFMPPSDDFVLRAASGPLQARVGQDRIGLASPVGRAFQAGGATVREVAMPAWDVALLAEHQVQQVLSVPIEAEGWRFGVLEVYGTGPLAFTAADTVFLQLLAATLVRALARQRRSEALRESQAFARAVMEASPDCVKMLSLDGRVRFMNRCGLEMNDLISIEDVIDREFAGMWPAAT